MNKVVELFGLPIVSAPATGWGAAVKRQRCPYLDGRCIKTRKSKPGVAIGTCTVRYGARSDPIVICPHRLLERRQVFADSIHLLTLHEPGNELHVIKELAIPGGTVDFVLVSAHGGRAVDFVGIEIQTLDTTGTVWPERQRFLQSVGVTVERRAVASPKQFGMNWKMTAKTTLVQLHHKVSTFEHLSKHLVLVVQDHLLAYMRNEFAFAHLAEPRRGDAMHFHAYQLQERAGTHRLELSERRSTTAAGVATALGLQTESRLELAQILGSINNKLSDRTLWTPA